MHRVIELQAYLFACACAYYLAAWCAWILGLRVTCRWVAPCERSVCALRLCGSACDGAAPATVRDADQALAGAATIRTTACTCASSLHWDMDTLTHTRMHTHVLEVMGLHLSRSAMRIRLSPSLLGASVLATRFV